jgi:hypothetical protein
MNEIRESVIESWDQDCIKKVAQSMDLLDISDEEEFPRIAGEWVREYFSKLDKNDIWKYPVLETHAGDRQASKQFREGLGQSVADSDWICTDILDETTCHAVEAVEKHGERVRVLVMIRPPDATSDTLCTGDGSGGDLYALNDFVGHTREEEPRYVIMVGKIGGGHGTRGLYRYVVEELQLEPWWKDSESEKKLLDTFPPVSPIKSGVMIIPITKKRS